MADWKKIDRALKGLASHDRNRLGERALAKGLITRPQLEELLATETDADPGRQAELMVQRGMIRNAEAESLLADLRREDVRPPMAAAGAELPEEARAAAADPERVFGRYLLSKEIGRGAMGTVWRAWDPGLGRWIALKILRDESSRTARDRFLREIRTAASLHHPHLVTVFDAGEWRGRPYLSMELVSGGPMDPEGPLPKSLETLVKVARALDEAHRRGIIHRDLKPGNIMVDDAGEPRIVDFGLAFLPQSDSDLTRTGAALGTPAYMAPEQIRGAKEEIGPASDIYALGAILYEAATGKTPHTGESSHQLFRRVLAEDPVPPRKIREDIARDIETIAMKALEKEPARRYPSAAAFANDLERHLKGEPISARPVGTLEQLWRKAVRHRRVVIPAIAGLLLVSVSITWAIRSVRKVREDAARREAADADALKRLEVARPSIDRAFQAAYAKDADRAAVMAGLREARAIIEDAIRRSPRLALGHHLLGRALELMGEEEAAEEAWRAAIAADPAFAPSRCRLAQLLMHRAFAESLEGADRPDPAADELVGMMKAAESGGDLEDDLQREALRAMSAYLRHQQSEVLAVCRKALLRFDGRPGSETFHLFIGLMSKGEEEIRGLDRAIEIRPSYAWALFSRAAALNRQKPGRGIPDLTRAIEARPRFVEAFYVRANARASTGDLKGAIADFTEALRIRPGFTACYNNRGLAHFRSGDPAAAVADYTEAIRRNPADPKYHHNRGCANEERRALAEALADYSEAIRLRPAGASSYYGRGSVRNDLGKFAEAEADLGEAIRLDPTYAPAFILRAHVRQSLGHFDDALADVERALALEPGNVEILIRRGAVLAAAGKLDAAVRDFDEAIRRSPRQPLPYLQRADIRRKKGDRAGALADYDRALELAPPGWPDRADVEKAIRELRNDY